MDTHPTSSNPSEVTGIAAERLANKLDQVAFRLEKIESQGSKEKPEKATPWYVVAIQVIGLPAALLALTLQWNQVRDTGVTRDKTVAETQKINAEELKTRAELQKLLDEITQKRALGIDAYDKALDQALPKIREALQNLSALRESATFSLAQKLLVKFIIIWIVFQGIGLVSDIVIQLTAAVMTPTLQFAHRTRWKKRNEGAKTILTTFLPMIIYVPSILFWSIRLFIFALIVVPFAFEIVVVIGGTDDTVRDIIEKFRTFRFAEAVESLRMLLGLAGGADV